jgi:hypothetical protein
MKKQVRKLKLCRETVQNLGSPELWEAKGQGPGGTGRICNTGESYCIACITVDISFCPTEC